MTAFTDDQWIDQLAPLAAFWAIAFLIGLVVILTVAWWRDRPHRRRVDVEAPPETLADPCPVVPLELARRRRSAGRPWNAA